MDKPPVAYTYPRNLAIVYDPDNPPAVIDGVLTPVGSFLGGLAKVSGPALNDLVVRRVLERTGFRFDAAGQVVEEDRGRLDLLVTANILGPDHGHGRQTIVRLGLGHLGAENVEKMCISGLKAINDGALYLTHPASPHSFVVASGTESLSRMPHGLDIRGKVLQKLDGVDSRGNPKVARTFYGELTLSKEKPLEVDLFLRDELKTGLTCPLTGLIMGQTAERLAKYRNVNKEQADTFAEASHLNAAAAGILGTYDRYLALVPGTNLLYHEGIVTDRISLEGIYQSDKFVFSTPDCQPPVITPRNSCPLNDGAAAVALATWKNATRNGGQVLGRILGYSQVGVDPSIMGLGPSPAIWMLTQATAQKLGVRADDIGVVNINEAFAAQALACRNDLRETYAIEVGHKLNLDGGSVAVGHPVGATLVRLVVETLQMLRARNIRYGIASACVGHGMGGAMLLENPDFDRSKPSEGRRAIEILEAQTGVERYKAIRRLVVTGQVD